jgi:double-strand break repair protein AddB
LDHPMFEPQKSPRVYGIPPGVDFPRALVDGLIGRSKSHPPEALAKTHLIVNTRRMARRIRALFDQGPALLLPKIELLTDLGDHWDLAHIPDAIPPLRRRLELVQLVSSLLERQPDLAPRSSLYDLADSLAALMDEMHGEGVAPDAISTLDITDQSGHWERIKSFLHIVRPYFEADLDTPDKETRQRLVIEHMTQNWQETPPDYPVIVAGSTGSRGATQLLMQAVAHLPQGAVILPGFDGANTPDEVWQALSDPMHSEDHPQYRFSHFATNLGISPTEIENWTATPAANPARNRVISLALRPAPVTDQWLRDGPLLTDINSAMAGVTLIEAPSVRLEAMAIALRLRQAAETGQTAALITPNRALTRQVTAALDRWNIIPDDSAGMPLHLSPPGRFLRHVGDLFRQRLDAEALLILLKHPLTHSGGARGDHVLLSNQLELHLRRHGPPYPQAPDIHAWAATHKNPMAADWVKWLCACFMGRDKQGVLALTDFVSEHITLAEKIAQGSQGEGTGGLWQHDAGREAQKTLAELSTEAPHGGALTAADYTALFHALLSAGEVRSSTDPHPNVLIWGTLEARVQGADLLILAGLNEGSWPEAPKPDPWLNRALRHQAGLLLPERRIGLSSHDFQQAVAAPEVWLSRSLRSDDAETVASRWLNRLQNLLTGLPDQGGKTALEDMRKRGGKWLHRVTLLEEPGHIAPAPRPAPCPPTKARPHRLSVTEIKRLIRDPYAIYGRHVLKLRPLDPLMQAPDALMRGIVLHDVLEQFVRATKDDPSLCTTPFFMQIATTVLVQSVPWAEARAMWLARLERVANWFIDSELHRRALANPAEFEAKATATLNDLGFTLSAKADRIDIDETGALHIYDYKTGAPPTKDQQQYFDKQLLLEAAIAQRSGFGDLDPANVARAVFIGLGSGGKEAAAPLETEPPEKIWAEFHTLISEYLSPGKGYVSRRAMFTKNEHGDYDQLARFGEWDITDDPVKEPL